MADTPLKSLTFPDLSDRYTIPQPYTSTPSALGTASAGSSGNFARGDHVHAKPTAADIGAVPSGQGLPSGGAQGQVLAKSSGTDYAVEWVNQSGGGSVSPYTSNPAALGTASPGSSANYSRGDHVHAMPSASDVGAAPAVTEVTNTSTGAVTLALDAGKIYHFTGAVSSLTLTLNAAGTGVIEQYHFDFNSGSTAATISVTGATWQGGSFTPEASKHYEVDILNGYGVYAAW